ncbi:SDR family NAD(P)-dependent oxidoreductase [Spongiactinospora rosea]|uniref:SDR family NAD(P)-dependent oxidoreductase n=1 Tax=Spongiactinospora rosea TaxID=2248750 RepID=A0A366M932_9ACTN|nr:NAD(P)H-binding protein [Spongiactinospora rosea]RBQ22049.1 SDR family NAD(P)-dependent oxidoreductase [Spongiactinospora rosea]
MDDILVLGATGKTGRRLVRLLRERDLPVRPASRSSAVPFDWSDPRTWEAAAKGAGAVYLIAPDDPAPVAGFVEQARRHGPVERFVVLSGRGIEHIQGDFGAGMIAAERAVAASGAEWTVLRANEFAQNFSEDIWHAPVRTGRLALPIGDVPEPFVDVEDLAAVAAAALTEDGHAGRIYELSGPEALTFRQAVEIMGRAAGRTIEYVELTPAAYRAELIAEGFPEAVADALGDMFALHRAGHMSEPTGDVRLVLGREPATFAGYAARAAAAGAWSA